MLPSSGMNMLRFTVGKRQENPIGRTLRQARLLLWLTQDEMAKEFVVSRQSITNWEAGKKLPKDRERWLELIKKYRLGRSAAEMITRIHFPDHHLTSEEWGRFGNPLLGVLSPKVGDFLSQALEARQIGAKSGDNMWRYKEEKTPPSAIFTHFAAEYRVTKTGYIVQETMIEMFQLTSEQGILTPLYIDPIQRSRKIEWNGVDISGELEEKRVDTDFIPKTSAALHFEGSLRNLEVGMPNRLCIRMESRLPLCRIGTDILAFCVPVFYSLDASLFSLILPEAGLKDIEILLAERKIDADDPLDWKDPAEVQAMKRDAGVYFSVPSTSKSVREKRYCPDLAIIKFRRASEDILTPDAAYLYSDIERPARIAATFLCGRKQVKCLAAKPRMI